MLDLFKQRRSARKFVPNPLSKEQIKAILAAGLLGPTSKNKHSPELFVVTDREKLQKLTGCRAAGTHILGTSALGIVVLGDTRKIDVWVEDASIATIMMQLQIESMGLASRWLQVREREAAEGGSSADFVRNVLGIEEHFGVLCVLAVSEKSEELPGYTDDDIDWSRVHNME